MSAPKESMSAHATRLARAMGRQEITREQAIAELRASYAITEYGASELLKRPSGSPDLGRRS